MAADESVLETFDNDETIVLITKLQATLRGCIIRKQMAEIRMLYQEIVHDIEGPEMGVIWGEVQLSCPAVKKVSKVSRQHQTQEKIKDKHSDALHIHKSKDCTNNSNYLPREDGAGSAKTVLHENILDHQIRSTNDDGQKAVLPQSSTYVSACSQTDSSRHIETDVDGGYVNILNINNTSHSKDSNSSRDKHEEELQSSSHMVVCAEVQTEETGMVLDSLFHGNSSHDKITSDVVDSDGEIPVTELKPHHVKSENSALDGQKLPPVEVFHLDSDGRDEDREKVDRENSSDESAEMSNTSHEEKHVEESGHQEVKDDLDLPSDRDELLQLKNTVAMELLWVQQAIQSRKHYLRLKQQLH